MIARLALGLGGALLLADSAAFSATAARPTILERAVTCGIDESEIAGLMDALAAEHAGMGTPVQRFAVPSGNLYHLIKPMGAMGYSTRDIYVAPTRIAMVASGPTLQGVAAQLRLAPVPYGPFERRIDGTRKIVAYQLHQGSLSGKVLIGCEYDDAGARSWLGANDTAF